MRINEGYFKENFIVDTENIEFYNIKTTDDIRVYGLYNYKNEAQFKRMPTEVAKATSEQVTKLHTNPTGGRIRFKTNSERLVIRVSVPNVSTRSIITMLNQAGFDLYQTVNGKQEYFGCLYPPIDLTDGYTREEKLFPGEKELTINMPLYNDVSDVWIGLEKGASLLPADDYKYEKPVFFYGSSITHGASVSRPGQTYEAMLSRRFNTNFINLGFASGAKAEDAIIEYMVAQDYSIFVSDYDHNAPSAEHLEATHEKLYKAIRAKHPDVPYIMLTKPILHYKLDNEENDRRRKIIYTTYQNAIASGDKNVYFIDGKEIFKDIPTGDCSADSVHPNDLGMHIMANAIAEVIEKNHLL